MTAPEVLMPKGCKFCPEPGAFSPSQIKLYSQSCKRKWAFRYIANIPEPERSFQNLGKEVHAHNEAYERHGTLPPTDTKAGQIATAGISELPKPNPDHAVEEHLYFKSDDIAFHGFADLMPHNEYSVYDYKTTSSYQYALKPEELAQDPQALIYGMARALREPTCDTRMMIRLVWLYYKTKPPYTTRKIETELIAGGLQRNFKAFALAPAKEMKAIRDAADPATFDPNSIPGNADACDSYGGCAYRSKCSLHKKETFGMLFADKMRAKKAQQASPADVFFDAAIAKDFKSQAEMIHPPTPEGAPPGDLAAAGQADARSELPHTKTFDDVIEATKDVTLKVDQEGLNKVLAPKEPAGPQFRESDFLDLAPDEREVLLQLRAEAEAPQVLAQGVIPPDAPAPIAELPPIPVAEPKKPRGRPKKLFAPNPAPESTPPLNDAPAAEVAPPPTPEPDPPVAIPEPPASAEQAKDDTQYEIVLRTTAKDDDQNGFILCVNTVPMGEQVTMLSNILQPIIKKLSEQLGVTHYRLADEAAYGRGDALLVSAYRESSPLLEGYVYADKRDADTNAILSCIETQALQVFRGGF